MRLFASVTAPVLGLAIVFASSSALATELSTDPPANTDPNGPPPPPPPMPDPGTVGSPTAPPPVGSTAAQLEEADQQDTGVGLHLVYIQPEVGFGVASIPSSLLGKDTGTPAGPVFGIGAGAELITFQIGARLRTLVTPQYNLWTVGGEFAYQPGSGRFWPRIGLAVGYAWANSFNSDLCNGVKATCDLIDVSGIDIGLRAGLQYFVTSSIEIGADAGLDALFLKRKAINGNLTYASDESGTGFMAVATAHLGFHF